MGKEFVKKPLHGSYRNKLFFSFMISHLYVANKEISSQ